LAAAVGIAPVEPVLPELPFGPAETERWRGFFDSLDRPAVGLNPTRAYPAKRWPEERFAELARRLLREGFVPVLLWGPGEEGVVARIHGAVPGAKVAPPTNLVELAAFLGHLAAVVTVDSGLKHLAVCRRVPTVTLFGPTDPREWHIGGERDRVLWRGVSCSPCRLRQCPFGDPPCMDLSVDAVWAALEGILD
jgi:heptosyltransferase-2